MTNLEAVNTILRAIGQVPVSDVPTTGFSDGKIAFDVLEEYANELQSEGYEFNTHERVELLPDVNGNITVPGQYIRITASDHYNRYTVRGNRIYDLIKDTDVFSDSVEVSAVELLPFEQLPFTLQRYVTIRAARVFANRVIGAGEQNSYNQEDEVRARLAWLNAVAEDEDMNVLSNNDRVRPNSYRPYKTLVR